MFVSFAAFLLWINGEISHNEFPKAFYGVSNAIFEGCVHMLTLTQTHTKPLLHYRVQQM